MNILILGGTGAMGKAVVQLLEPENILTVTSRSSHQSHNENVRYIKGNAKEMEFLKEVIIGRYDAIIDFMVYSTAEFSQRYALFLEHTDQYVFISSARVYAQSETLITENTPRLLDSLDDREYLATDEYALAKARCEDLLNNSGKYNYTIIRPSITYGKERLQLGVLEKENWIYRAMHGRSIVFSRDIASKYTAMTAGEDVAKGIVSLLGKPQALGETYHITSGKSYTWEEILSNYIKTLEHGGVSPAVVMTEKSVKLKTTAKYQVIYCRYFDRKFDNSKIKPFVNTDDFKDPMEGLAEVLHSFLENPEFKNINWGMEGMLDRAAGECTPLKEIASFRGKILYLLRRYGLDFVPESVITLKAAWNKYKRKREYRKG